MTALSTNGLLIPLFMDPASGHTLYNHTHKGQGILRRVWPLPAASGVRNGETAESERHIDKVYERGKDKKAEFVYQRVKGQV